MSATRLLPLLSMIETALIGNGSPSVSKPGTRMVNFHKGLARLVFTDGSGSIALQGFALADGQVCLKAALRWSATGRTLTEALYPQEDFDWSQAADKIAQAWIAGPADATQDHLSPLEGSPSPLERLAATG